MNFKFCFLHDFTCITYSKKRWIHLYFCIYSHISVYGILIGNHLERTNKKSCREACLQNISFVHALYLLLHRSSISMFSDVSSTIEQFREWLIARKGHAVKLSLQIEFRGWQKSYRVHHRWYFYWYLMAISFRRFEKREQKESKNRMQNPSLISRVIFKSMY